MAGRPGDTVFVISGPIRTNHADNSMDAYVKDGVIAALDAVKLATGEADADLVSYCLGGARR
jgi:polyhydroxyalkanoate synthase